VNRYTQEQAEQAEQAAAELLAEFGVEGPAINVEELAKGLGVHIERRPHSPEISGLLYRDPGDDGERIVIGVNDDDALVRQRFTIAHELGHLQLNHNAQLFVDRDLRINLVRRVATELSEGRRPFDETFISDSL
jgi:hypothetical protein